MKIIRPIVYFLTFITLPIAAGWCITKLAIIISENL